MNYNKCNSPFVGKPKGTISSDSAAIVENFEKTSIESIHNAIQAMKTPFSPYAFISKESFSPSFSTVLLPFDNSSWNFGSSPESVGVKFT